MENILLYYLRHFPFNHFKNKLEGYVELPDKDILYKSPSGIKYKLNTGDHVMRQIYLKGVYESNTFGPLSKLIKPTDTFVDVGANIGAYSVGLSQFIKKGRIISFEPNPGALKYLEKNIELNNIENITVVKRGLSNTPEKVTLYTPSLTTASINKHQDSDQKEVIELITLDNYCEENGINNIDILKIDIEGHEIKCLKGALEIIAKSKDMILIMEIDDNCLNVGKSKEETFEFIQNLGFEAFLPKGFPFGLKKTKHLPSNYRDNILFKK